MPQACTHLLIARAPGVIFDSISNPHACYSLEDQTIEPSKISDIGQNFPTNLPIYLPLCQLSPILFTTSKCHSIFCCLSIIVDVLMFYFQVSVAWISLPTSTMTSLNGGIECESLCTTNSIFISLFCLGNIFHIMLFLQLVFSFKLCFFSIYVE